MPDGGPDDVSISASMQGDLVAALGEVDEQLEDTGDEAERMGEKGRAGGKAFAAGMKDAARGADRARDASGRFVAAGGRANETLRDTARDSRLAASGLDKFSRKAQKAAKSAGGLGAILMMIKWGAIITAVFALVGGLSALAAGAAIAIGGLAPMAGVLAGALPLWAATKLSVAAVKLAADELEPTLNRIKKRFTDLGPVIARGGLQQGLDYFGNSLDKLSALTGRGLASLGGQLGNAARQAGNMAKSAPFLNQIRRIFYGLEPIVGNLSKGMLFLVRALLNVLEAALPMAQSMAAVFAQNARRLQLWTAEQLANGRMAAWLNKAWQTFRRTVGVVADFLVGMFNIFRIAAGYSTQMGTSIEATAAKFRAWTESAGGQARINRYFQESLPALREMGRLLGMIARGFGSMAANANVAPLLAQIRTELAPAVSDLVNNMAGQGGLGPATISAAAAMVRLIASLDFSALTMFLQALAGVVNAIVWIGENVPGASFVISGLLGAFLGFKVLGPVFSMVAGGAKAFAWISAANKMTGELSMMQKVVGGLVLPMLRTLAGFLGGVMLNAIKGIGIAIRFAFVTTPIGWIILAIAALVAGFIYLWNHSAAFRDFFIGIWNAIRTAFMAVVNAIVTAWSALVNALKAAWQATVGFIITVARWIWDHGLKQVLGFIVGAFKVQFAIIAFIVQTVVYIIMAIVAGLAWVFEKLWQGITAGAQWAFNNVILPVVNFFKAIWDGIVSAASVIWQLFVARISSAWTGFYNNVIAPVVNFIRGLWNGLVSGLSAAWQLFVARISGIWRNFTGVVSSVVGGIRSLWSGLTSWLSSIFKPVGTAISAVFTAIGKAAGVAGGVIKGIWDGVLNALKAVWNVIARVWNAIPSVTVPDWVPGIGGTTFGLPKMPILWSGGEAPGGRALVGELGPEPLVRNGQVVGMLGQHGPEVASIPPGGYVVPNLDTLKRMPGLTKTLPSAVAAAVSRSVPGYGSVLAHEDGRSTAPAPAGSDTRALERRLAELTAELRRRPPTVEGNGDIAAEVERVMRKLRREDELHARYSY